MPDFTAESENLGVLKASRILQLTGIPIRIRLEYENNHKYISFHLLPLYPRVNILVPLDQCTNWPIFESPVATHIEFRLINPPPVPETQVNPRYS